MSLRQDILTRMAVRLKESRKARNLSLDALAELSGVSRSMVSQIERGESSPTVSTLWNLTQALKLDFADLVEEPVQSRGIEIMPAASTPTISTLGQGCRIRILNSPEKTGQHEVYELEFQSNGSLDSAPHGPKAKEQLMVISGVLEVTSGENKALVHAGDTARYDANCPHTIYSPNGCAMAFLIVENS
ncbi:MAG: XRE family transcriptional regulator [Planktomarina sp.]|nr:XRE family transcriptional regulator [Planktomarina sp.]